MQALLIPDQIFTVCLVGWAERDWQVKSASARLKYALLFRISPLIRGPLNYPSRYCSAEKPWLLGKSRKMLWFVFEGLFRVEAGGTLVLTLYGSLAASFPIGPLGRRYIKISLQIVRWLFFWQMMFCDWMKRCWYRHWIKGLKTALEEVPHFK